MHRRVVAVALSLALAAPIFAWSAGASTPPTSSSSSGGATSVDVRPLLEEQAQIQHAKTMDLMQRVQDRQLEHQAKMRQLGDRAPVETFAPLATIPPMATVPPPPG